jgi:hypothetical protein
MLEPAFKTLQGMKRFHHFAFSSEAPGTVVCKEFVDSEQEVFNLLRNEGFEFDAMIMPTEIKVRGLTEERRQYLSKKCHRIYKRRI